MQRSARDFPEVLTFLRALWALDHALNARSKRMLSEVGVTGPQRLVIRALGREPGSSPAEVARVLHLNPGSVTRLVAALERSGMVTRREDPTDSRKLRLLLSAKGKRVDAATGGTVEEAVHSVLSRIPSRRVAQSMALLHQLAEALLPEDAVEEA